MSARDLLWRVVVRFFEDQAVDLKMRGLYVGECATWSITAHRLECLSAELRDAGLVDAAARVNALADDASRMAEGAAAALKRRGLA